MGVGNSGSRLGAIALALLVTAALCAAALVTDAGAAKLVGKDGKVYACYRTKGKAKGAVHLVSKKAHCKKGQKKVSWNVTGPAGEAGQSEGGENGANGEPSSAGEPGAKGEAGLEARVQTLTTKVTSLESVLKGITNTELLGALTKLQGISPTQLQEAVTSVADVKALCTQASALTNQLNAVGTAFGGIKLGGVIPVLLELVVPAAPKALAPFGC
jgi:hypothetical protein